MRHDDTDYLLISVYMPVNYKTYESYNIFGDVLNEISSLLQFHDSHNIVFAGDFNHNTISKISFYNS